MKTLATRLEDIFSAEALWRAWRGYRRSKRNRPSVAEFEIRSDLEVLRLRDEILGGTWTHGRYRVVRIEDPKPRLIAVAAVRDRVVHRALYEAVGPWFESSYTADSYACIEGRGSHRAIFRYAELLRRFPFVMHLDIRRYFPSIDHAVLSNLVTGRLRDERVGAVVRDILQSGAALYRTRRVRDFYGLDAQQLRDRPQGLPIGSLTSQWWGNLYLNGLDHFVKRSLKVPGYVRYMDDFVLFGNEKPELSYWQEQIRGWLAQNRRLALNPHKLQIRRSELDQPFIGHRVRRAGWDIGSKAVRRYRRKLKTLLQEGDLDRLERSLVSWRAIVNF